MSGFNSYWNVAHPHNNIPLPFNTCINNSLPPYSSFDNTGVNMVYEHGYNNFNYQNENYNHNNTNFGNYEPSLSYVGANSTVNNVPHQVEHLNHNGFNFGNSLYESSYDNHHTHLPNISTQLTSNITQNVAHHMLPNANCEYNRHSLSVQPWSCIQNNIHHPIFQTNVCSGSNILYNSGPPVFEDRQCNLIKPNDYDPRVHIKEEILSPSNNSNEPSSIADVVNIKQEDLKDYIVPISLNPSNIYSNSQTRLNTCGHIIDSSNRPNTPIVEDKFSSMFQSNRNETTNELARFTNCMSRPEITVANSLNMSYDEANINGDRSNTPLDIKPIVASINEVIHDNSHLDETCLITNNISIKTEPIDECYSDVDNNIDKNMTCLSINNPLINEDNKNMVSIKTDIENCPDINNQVLDTDHTHNEQDLSFAYVTGKLFDIKSEHSFICNGNTNQSHNNEFEMNTIYGSSSLNVSNDVGSSSLSHVSPNYHEAQVYNTGLQNLEQNFTIYSTHNISTTNDNSTNRDFDNTLGVHRGSISPVTRYNHTHSIDRNPSPERKYSHLVRADSSSPERKFLERINKPRTTKKRAYRSSKSSISSSSSEERPRIPPPSYSRNSDDRKKKLFRFRSTNRTSTSVDQSSQRYNESRSTNRASTSVDQSSQRYNESRSTNRTSTSVDQSSQRYNESRSTNRISTSVDRCSQRYNEPSRRKKVSRTKDTNNHSRRQHSNELSRSEYFNNKKPNITEREELLRNYTKNYCSNMNEVRNMMDKLSELTPEEMMKREAKMWSRVSPATLYYKRTNTNVVEGTQRLADLCKEFEEVLLKQAENIRAAQPKYDAPIRKRKMKFAKHRHQHCRRSSSTTSSNSSSGSEINTSSEEDRTIEELVRKQAHPYRLHRELWFNDHGDMNDGPLCRCSAKARRSGIRHNIYAGEHDLPKCNLNSNNGDKLFHYRITISPPTNFLIKTPTIISHDDHEFIFEGFSMFSHRRLDKLPVCKVIRFNIEYTILYFEEQQLENFTIRELDLFNQYLFKEILEMVDLDLKAFGDVAVCDQFHFMPRFVRELSDYGKEILSMNEVMKYLLNCCDDLVKHEQLESITSISQYEWQKQVDLIKGMVVTIPGMKPCALRVDQLDRDEIKDKSLYPVIVHFGIRPPQLSYAGNPEYQKAWREYVKFRHLLANMSKPSFEDKRKLELKEMKLQEMRTQNKMKRDVTVTVNSKGFKKTGIMCDIVQHAMLIPVLVSHLRFHCSLSVLETAISYKFKNRYLLQLALTHPSYRENFGTNPDHARNSLTNCGIRQPEYGDRRIHYMNTRKRGINTLINIMSRFGKKKETESNITHNERLEFLGDAVVEFITSIHLFHMFPELEEGGLATYRAAIVQNQHLAVLARVLKLDEFMLYAHGSDLCHDLELRHAMANCFEALMGALFLDGGIKVADKVFGETLFKNDPDLLSVWVDYPPHPLQEQEPLGDRKWISRFDLLQRLTVFEETIGIEFTHIRLLARAFTDRSIGFTNLTLGSNQRLEFLGDTVLQLIASEYLYKYFPEHHEGHLSLLRSSLVNNRTQAVVCDDLGMIKYSLYNNPKAELKTKDRADLLEAFLGALYVDKGLKYCVTFCNVCFFPRLQTFIMKQDWNDPKSKLQQCCLTLRTMEGGEPEIPIYKVIECMGPTNTRVYTVAVYFKGQRLAEASGHSIQQAEMNAANKALQRSYSLFPQLDHQKRVIAKSVKKQVYPKSKSSDVPKSSLKEIKKVKTPTRHKKRSKDCVKRVKCK